MRPGDSQVLKETRDDYLRLGASQQALDTGNQQPSIFESGKQSPNDSSYVSQKRVGAKRGRKPKDFEVYRRESKIRIREFKAMAKDLSKSVEERKKWRSCASALKTRLSVRCKEEEEKR